MVIITAVAISVVDVVFFVCPLFGFCVVSFVLAESVSEDCPFRRLFISCLTEFQSIVY